MNYTVQVILGQIRERMGDVDAELPQKMEAAMAEVSQQECPEREIAMRCRVALQILDRYDENLASPTQSPLNYSGLLDVLIKGTR